MNVSFCILDLLLDKKKIHDSTNISFSRGALFSDSDYHWVLTVPAIWEDAAKQFMREAAEKVGFFHSCLTHHV